ncbi:hypothetical protein QBC46DRAFT_141535 [Diplogelasinospora grovesii]|uniref:Uncharacterized protein n=1 Tax=Diplogelasinospora grovesii TaxID=303347 RepID=A0AAN6S3H2_9PEZI|nr:hypothetical protein QBC46DRAFT_141535 [Diplogelasinospora grovesii]
MPEARRIKGGLTALVLGCLRMAYNWPFAIGICRVRGWHNYSRSSFATTQRVLNVHVPREERNFGGWCESLAVRRNPSLVTMVSMLKVDRCKAFSAGFLGASLLLVCLDIHYLSWRLCMSLLHSAASRLASSR